MNQTNEVQSKDYSIKLKNLAVFSVKVVGLIHLNSPIEIDGKMIDIIPMLRVKECVDMTTGEIIPFSQAEKLGFKQLVQVGALMKQREAILNSLRKEVKEFALFLLEFRNKRGGITPDANEICKLYAELYDMRASDVRRYLKKLKEAKVLASNYLLEPLFQIHSASMSARQYLSEEFESELAYERVKSKLRNKCVK